MTQLAAILTGDLIKSTESQHGRIDSTMQVLATVAKSIDDDTRFTRFRGDGWQIYLHNGGNCLWACLLILARLKANDRSLATRVSVGLGMISNLPDRDLSAASGSAFITSGRGLDEMPKTQSVSINGDGVDKFQKSIFAFAAERAENWSREQAEAMAYALDANMPSRTKIASQLGISRQAVDSRLTAAGYRLLDQACLAFLDHYTPTEMKAP